MYRPRENTPPLGPIELQPALETRNFSGRILECRPLRLALLPSQSDPENPDSQRAR